MPRLSWRQRVAAYGSMAGWAVIERSVVWFFITYSECEVTMGGLFNTPGTIAIIKILHDAYTRKNFQTLSNDRTHVADLLNTTNLSTYDFCVKYRLITDDPTFNTRWKTWLNYFDNNGGDQIRKDMAAACQDLNTFTGIEFFAIPSQAFAVQQSRQFPDQENANMYTLIVSVETPTYDNLP
jgi:hypothetical protein